jgi:general secretion pathway protein K
MKDERGFALLAALLVLAMLGVIGAEFAYSMRLEASAVRSWKQALTAAHLAEAGIEQALRELAADPAFAVVAEDNTLTFFTRERAAIPRLPRTAVPLAGGRFTYRITDEEARINLNTAPPDRIDRLLQVLGVEKTDRDVIGDSLQDWRDANEEHRLNGAESDYYLGLAVPYRSRNGNLESVAELLQIKGVTRALYDGREGRRGLAELVTVKAPGQVNINTAAAEVLRALGLSDAEVIEIVQTRREGPYTTLPGRYAGRNLGITTRTYRIEADGLIDGQVRARATMIVQRRADAGGTGFAVLDWSGIR